MMPMMTRKIATIALARFSLNISQTAVLLRFEKGFIAMVVVGPTTTGWVPGRAEVTDTEEEDAAGCAFTLTLTVSTDPLGRKNAWLSYASMRPVPTMK